MESGEQIATYPLPFRDWKSVWILLPKLFYSPVRLRKERCFCLSFANAKLVKIFRIGKNTGFACEPRGFFPCSAIFFMPFICSLYNNFANKGIGYESGKCKGVVLPEKERGVQPDLWNTWRPKTGLHLPAATMAPDMPNAPITPVWPKPTAVTANKMDYCQKSASGTHAFIL